MLVLVREYEDNYPLDAGGDWAFDLSVVISRGFAELLCGGYVASLFVVFRSAGPWANVLGWGLPPSILFAWRQLVVRRLAST